jgi:hypothetical protein
LANDSAVLITLVAGARGIELVVVVGVGAKLPGAIDPLRDVRRLLVDRGQNRAAVGVEPVLGAVVADPADRLAGDRRDVDVGLGRDLAGDQDEAGVDQALAGDPPFGVVAHDGIEDAVGDLVADLVRMALGDRLGGEQVLAFGELADLSHLCWLRSSADLNEDCRVDAFSVAADGQADRLEPIEIGAETRDDPSQPDRLGQLDQPLEVEED